MLFRSYNMQIIRNGATLRSKHSSSCSNKLLARETTTKQYEVLIGMYFYVLVQSSAQMNFEFRSWAQRMCLAEGDISR